MKKLAFVLALVMVLALFPMSAFAADSDYVQTLFDQSKLIEIDIQMSDEDWDNMIATASSEEYSACDLVVNGELYENVAIRPKGNSSLLSVTGSGSERYSWRIKFDKFEKGRTCDGLDILILNNGFKDPGELHEALAYDMYAFLDADASLYNYAIVTVNGEYFGVYLALEGVDESFAERNYGEDYGELYKPEMGGGGGDWDRDDIDIDFTAIFSRASDEPSDEMADETGEAAAEGEEAPLTEEVEEPEEAPAEPKEVPASEEPELGESAAEGEEVAEPDEGEETESDSSRPDSGEKEEASGEFSFPGFGDGGGFSASDSSLALALNYVGDDLESYSGIWDSAKFKSDEEDYARVVEALKHVCEGDDIAGYLDVDNVLKYLAIQTFVYNHDGLTGNVTHNYYLYEEDGKLNLIPWDLNEAFTVSGNGKDFVNFPIDTPFTVTDLSQRSFFMALLENEEYLAQYHEYLRQLCEDYVQGGAFEETYERIRSQIDELVKTDPTAFADYEEFDATAEGLKTVIGLRAEGVLGQLSGEIPSTREGQEAEPEKLMDTSEADLSGLTGGSSSEMRW